MRSVVVSAPGKMLLVGGYSILEKGNVAYTVGINKRVFANLESLSDGKIEFCLPQFGITAPAEWSGDEIVFEGLDDQARSRLTFVKNAAELTACYLRADGDDVGGFRLTTANEPGFTYQWGQSKSGFGSSSAVTGGTVGSFFAASGRDIAARQERDRINKLAQVAHFLSQGKVGSGFDVSTATFGAHVYRRFSEDIVKSATMDRDGIRGVVEREWDYFVGPLEFPNIETAIAFTGRAASTKDMVGKVNSFKAASPEEYSELMGSLNAANENTIRALKEYTASGDLQELARWMNETRVLTRRLGETSGAPIEPADLTRILDAALDAGAAAAKLPGAGGGDSVVALCRDGATKENVYRVWEGMGIKPLPDVEIARGEIGVRQEEPHKFRDMTGALGLAGVHA